MALQRLARDDAYTWIIASPLAFADISAPTVDELNANPTNDPSGNIFTITCAVSQDGSQFDLDESDLDDTLTFCQISGSGEKMDKSATVVIQFEESKDRWLDASSLDAEDGFNTANLVRSLLMWRGVEYYVGLRVSNKDPDAPFEADDRIKLVEVATDNAVPVTGTGSNIQWTQTFAKRSNIAWGVKVVA